MSRIVALYLIGVVIAVGLLWFGLALDQPAASTAAILVALSVGLLALLPQLLSANGNRYAQHKEYFVSTLLPQAGTMRLIAGDGVVFLSSDRIAWKLRDDRVPLLPGAGETPFFKEMLRPHLRSGMDNQVWAGLAAAFFRAEDRVSTYTATRRRFDSAFNGRLEGLLREEVGEGYRAKWWNERASDFTVAESKYAVPTYNAGNFRTPCLMWYSGRYESDVGVRWDYSKPVAAAEDRSRGLTWRVKVGEGDGRDYIWGGPVPMNIQETAKAVEAIIETLRDDGDLKQLYLASVATEDEASDSLQPLPLLADNAANLLQHGPDIPGSCPYCAQWSPRL